MGFSWVGVGGAYDGWDRSVVCVADGLLGFLETCKHCIVHQFPQLGRFGWVSSHMKFEVGEVIDE